MCSICLENVEDCMPMLCGHRMHVRCMHGLLKRAEFDAPAKCPLCRGDIEMQSAADKLSLEGFANDDEDSFKAALALDPNHVFSMYCLGLFAGMNGDYPKAIEMYRRGLAKQVLVTANRYYMHVVAAIHCGVELATLYFENDMLDEAKTMLDISAIKLKKIKLQKSVHSVNIWMGYASIALKMGLLDDASEAYEKLLLLAPADIYGDTMSLYVAALRRERPVQAVLVARRFYAALNTIPVASLLATCLWETQEEGACAEAVPLFEYVCANSPEDEFEHIKGRFYLGMLKHRSGDDLAAIDHFMSVLPYGEHENAAEAHRCLAEIFSAYEMHTQALRLLNRAEQIEYV